MRTSHFDPSRHAWRKLEDEPELSYKVGYEYTILGHDIDAGTLDMMVRWNDQGGHCHLHRHTATTTVLVLEGEQHLWDIQPDGSKGEHRVRRAGDYALTTAEALPHLERGGPEGGLAFFGCHSSDGKLYEILDEEMNLVVDVTMEVLIADFEANT